MPQDSVIKIGGKNFDIQEAWLEHPHIAKPFKDEILQGIIYVLGISMSRDNFSDSAWRNMNVHHYIKEYGYGNTHIRSYLPDENMKDTIVVHYRYPSNDDERKGFVLIKKK